MTHPISLVQMHDVIADPPKTGYVVLTDRLWPRGTRKEALAHVEWYKSASPATELRKGFHAGTLSPAAFKKAYRQQLDADPAQLAPLIAKAREQPLYLVTATHDPNTSYLTVLKQAILDAL